MNTTLAIPSQQAITIRVVFDGAPFAGKTTAAYSLSRVLGGEATTPAEEDGRTVWFDWLTYSGGHHEGRDIRVELVTVPGQARLASRRRHLLLWGDVVVFVADTSKNAFASTVAMYSELLSDLELRGDLPIVVIANKRDLADAVPIQDVRTQLGLSDSDLLVEVIATSGGGLREAFIHAVRAALTSSATRLEETSAEDLLAQMHTSLDAIPHGTERPSTWDDEELDSDVAEDGTEAVSPFDEVADQPVDSTVADLHNDNVATDLAELTALEIDNIATDLDEHTDLHNDNIATAADNVDELSDVDIASLETDLGELTALEIDSLDSDLETDDLDTDLDELTALETDDLDTDLDELTALETGDLDTDLDELTALETGEEPAETLPDAAFAEDAAPEDGPGEIEPAAPQVLTNARLNPDGIADGAGVMILSDYWKLLVSVANGQTNLPLDDGSAEAALAVDLVSWGLLVGSTPDAGDRQYREMREIRRSLRG